MIATPCRLVAVQELEIQGNLVDHEYTISSNSHKIAEVSKKWFRVRETYGVELEPARVTFECWPPLSLLT